MEKLLSLLAQDPVSVDLANTVVQEIDNHRKDIRALVNILLSQLADKNWGSLEANCIVTTEIDSLLKKHGFKIGIPNKKEWWGKELYMRENPHRESGTFVVLGYSTAAQTRAREIVVRPDFPNIIAIEKDETT